MGSAPSQSQQLEAQLVHLHDGLVNGYRRIKRVKITRGTVSLFYYFLVIILIFLSCARVFINRSCPPMEIVQTLCSRELLSLSVITAVWALFTFFCSYISARNSEHIELYRLQMVTKLEKYQEVTNLVAVRKALKDAGQADLEIGHFSISASDFGANDSYSANNSIFSRIAHAIVNDGPDHQYAVLCPRCHHHNGIIDKADIPNLKYNCPFCSKLVTYNEIIKLSRTQLDEDDDLSDPFDMLRKSDSEDYEEEEEGEPEPKK